MRLYLDCHKFDKDGDPKNPTVHLDCFGDECSISYGVGDFRIPNPYELDDRIIELIDEWNSNIEN